MSTANATDYVNYSPRSGAVTYRRAESEPAPSSARPNLMDIRSKFESTSSEVFSTPEFGLAFGSKKASDSSLTSRPESPGISTPPPGSKVSSPRLFVKHLSQPNGLHLQRQTQSESVNNQQSNLDTVSIGRDANFNKTVASKERLVKRPTGFTKLDTRTKANGTNVKLIGNGYLLQHSKQTTPDDNCSGCSSPFVTQFNAGIVAMSNKLNLGSPTSPSVCSSTHWGKVGFERVKSSDSVSSSQLSSPTGSLPDYVYTSKIDSKLLAAKSFWSKKSQEVDPASILPVELGTDFSGKNHQKATTAATSSTTATLSAYSGYSAHSKPVDDKLPIPLIAKNHKIVDRNDNHLDVGVSSSASSVNGVGTAAATSTVSARYQRLASINSEDTKSNKSSQSLSKSPSQSSVASSLDGSVTELSVDYMNVMPGRVPRRVNSKPPQNIVARRTQMFEKSVDEINAVASEAEAYRKMRELGTAFKVTEELSDSKAGTAKELYTQVNKKSVVSSAKSNKSEMPSVKVGAVGKPEQLSAHQLAQCDKLSDKPVEMFRNMTYESAVLAQSAKFSAAKPQPMNESRTSDAATATVHKVLPDLAASRKSDVVDKGQLMFNARARDRPSDYKPELPAKPSKDGSAPPLPPPKPPRTFQHWEPSFSDTNRAETELAMGQEGFDPSAIPRQAGDGQEQEGGNSGPSNPACHTADRVYTMTTAPEPRPYTSLNHINDGSGGDDSLYGSENAYDTLGKSSAASSYDHYDTISQSELDSDISRPPTLPRRPSNLRHSRPLSTAFSHMDITKHNQQLLHSQLHKALTAQQTIKETSPTSPSPTKIKVPFKLKYLLPKAKRKADAEMRKAASVACLAEDVLYDSVEILPPGTTMSDEQIDQSSSANNSVSSSQNFVCMDEAGYAVPEINKANKRFTDGSRATVSDPQQSKAEKNHEKIRARLNQAFSALKKPAVTAVQTSDGEDEERAPDVEILEQRLRHCTTVRSHAIYASAEQIKGFMTRVYAQLYDYAVIVSLRKNPDTNVYEPYVKYKFPPQVNVEQTTVPQFCFPDGHIWHKTTEYKSEAFSFVLTDVTGNRQYGYCRRLLPPDLNNVPRMAEVICVVSPLNATKLYSQLLDEVEKRRLQSSIHAEEFLQAVYGRPMPNPGQSVTIRAMNVYEEPESLVFTRSPDSQREGIDYESLLNMLSVSQIVKIFASILLERKVIFIAEKLSTLSSCVHAFISLLYPFSWQHTFIPLLPPNLIDIVCAPTPYVVGLLSSNYSQLTALDDELEGVLVVDLDNHKFMQRIGDEKAILPKKLHRSLVSALEMAKSESQGLRSLMVGEAFLRFFLETVGNFNEFMIHIPGEGRQFLKEEFVSQSSIVPSIATFLHWFSETQMFEVYTTERENDRNVISGTFEERVYEFKTENHDEFHIDNRKFKKFKLFGKKGKR